MAENVDIVVSVIDEATKELTKISDSFKQNFGKAEEASRAVVTAFAGIGVAAAGFSALSINQFSNVGDAIEKMAARTGISAEAISGLRVAAEGAGTSIESVEIGIRMMQRNMQMADNGSTELQNSLQGLGVTLSRDFVSMNPAQQFELLGQSIGKIEDPTKRTQAAMVAFGKSGGELIPLFEDGAFDLEQWQQKAKDLGVSFDDLSAGQAAQLNDAIGEMKIAVSGVALEIGGRLAPYVISAVSAFQAWYREVGGVDGLFQKFQTKLDQIRPILPIIAGGIIGAMVPALVTMGAALWASATAALAAFVALLPFIVIGALIGAAIYVIYQSIRQVIEALPELSQIWTELWQGIHDFFFQIWSSMKTTVEEKIAEIRSNVTEGITFVSTVWTTVTSGILNFTRSLWENIKMGILTKLTEIGDFLSGWIQTAQVMWGNLWNSFTNVAAASWESVKSVIRSGINWVIGQINRLIDSINSVLTRGAGLLGVSVATIPNIPMLAQGGNIVRAGSAIVGEAGPELVQLPTGARVTPLGGGAGGITININNPYVLNDQDIVDKIGDPIVQVLKQHMAIA